jgi:hypothetical protein
MKSINFKASALHLALLGAVALPLAGCGGNTASTTSSTSTPGSFTGIAVDGALSGATVTLDVNNNGICDVNEPKSTTTALGAFSFLNALGAHATCASGGSDTTTGKPFVGEMKAVAGATVISPLTTILANNPALTPAVLATQLGLAGTNLLTADPTAPGNTALLAAGTAMQQMVQQVATALAASSGLTNPTAAQMTAIMAVVGTQLAAQPLTATSLTTGAAALATSLITTSAPALSANANTGITAATAPTAAQATTLATSVSSSVAASVSSIATATTPAAITASANNAVVAVAAITSSVAVGGGLPNVVPVAGTSVNGTATVANAATATGGITNAAMTFGALVGAPVTTGPVSVSFAVTSTVAGDARTFNGTISGLTVANTAGVLSFAAPAAATATLSGTHTNGAALAATQTGAALASWVAAPAVNGVGGGVQLNVATILAAVNNAAAGGVGLNLLKGNFNVTVTVSGLQLSNAAATAITPSQTINVTVN